MSAAVSYERVQEHLEFLKLDSALADLDVVLESGQKRELTHVEVIDDLLTRERSSRFGRRVQTNLKLSGIPTPRMLDNFDFDAQKSVSKSVIDELSTLRFLHQGENIIIPGAARDRKDTSGHRPGSQSHRTRPQNLLPEPPRSGDQGTNRKNEGPPRHLAQHVDTERSTHPRRSRLPPSGDHRRDFPVRSRQQTLRGTQADDSDQQQELRNMERNLPR